MPDPQTAPAPQRTPAPRRTPEPRRDPEPRSSPGARPATEAPSATGATGATGATAASDATATAGARPRGRTEHVGWLRRRAVGPAAEAAVALGAAALLLALSRSIDVDPLDRIGQVSGLAALQLRFFMVAVPVIGAVALAGRRLRHAYPRAVGLACAAFAGLLGGLVGGGLVVALRGTPWGLYADGGDVGHLASWADGVLHGRPAPSGYPPGAVWALALVAKLGDMPTGYANKSVEIVGLALIAPVSYLCWRTLLSPVLALAVGVTAALPLLQPYKPYEYLVLVALVPAVVNLVRAVRRCPGWSLPRAGTTGALAGVLFGVLFLGYSGWFLWSAPGAGVALLAAFPWRRGAWTRGAALLGAAVPTFLAVAGFHLVGLLRAARTVKDSYFYFDTYTDPAYVAMWRESLPGPEGAVWPPVAELGGVGLFTVVLVVGLGVAVALGGRDAVVAVPVALVAGAWALRFFIASQMYRTQTVQLYPRTTAEILYCLLLLTGLAAGYLVPRRLARRPRPDATAGDGAPRVPVTVGLLTALVLFFGSAGSATADRVMPVANDSLGKLAWLAQLKQRLDGGCSRYSRPSGEPPSTAPGSWVLCVPRTPTPAGGPRER